MAESEVHELIIVRHHEEEEHEHHSSAWKVAHADFMTAMMAFFLIMWLLNATDEKVRKGVSEYFNPIHLSAGSTDLKGLNSPNAAQVDSKGEKGYSDKVVPVERFNPLKLTQGHADTKVKSAVDGAGASSPPDGSPVPSQGTAPADAASTADGTGGGGGAGAALTKAAFDAREHKAFQDPYAILAKLAASVDGTGPTSADVVIGDSRRLGMAGGDVDRDPFDPVYWQLAKAPPARTAVPGKASSMASVGSGAVPDAAAANTGDLGRVAPDGSVPPSDQAAASGAASANGAVPPNAVAMKANNPAAAGKAPAHSATAMAAAVAARAMAAVNAKAEPSRPARPAVSAQVSASGAAAAALQANPDKGTPAIPPAMDAASAPPVDASAADANQAAMAAPAPSGAAGSGAAAQPGTVDSTPQAMPAGAPAVPTAALAAAGAGPGPAIGSGISPSVAAEAKAVSGALAQSVKDLVGTGASPHVEVKPSADGVLIDLTDDAKFSMFDIGSAIPNARVVKLMEHVAQALTAHPGQVIIRGYTDGRPFHTELYDNWRLSAARAHMAYYMLVRGGLAENRVERIEGYADHDLKVPADPYAAENRRIEILLKGSKP